MHSNQTDLSNQTDQTQVFEIMAVGIDVAKDKLDVQAMRSRQTREPDAKAPSASSSSSDLKARKARKNATANSYKTIYKQFDNTPAGFAKLLRWVQQLLSPVGSAGTAGTTASAVQAHYCMESTGPHSQALALFLAEQGQLVSIVNPYLIKRYGEAVGMLTKNDKADARVIADYCRTQSPAHWFLSRPQVRTLVALVRRLQGLEAHLLQEKNRLQEPNLIKPVVRSLTKSVRFLEKEMAALKDEIRRHIDSDDGPDGLKKSRELLLSIPGIGETLATTILAELPDVSAFETASSVGAYAGLSPKENKSGKSVDGKTRISRRGNAQLRRALYMPALVAFRCNPLLSDLYERLLKRGLSKKAAVCAVMRKLLMLAYGVLKSREPFQLNWAQQRAHERNNNNPKVTVASAIPA